MFLVATTAMVENPTDAGNRETKIAERKIIRRGGDREETRRHKRGRRIGACGIALRPGSPHGQQGKNEDTETMFSFFHSAQLIPNFK